MRIDTIFSNNLGEEKVKSIPEIWDEIKKVLTNDNIHLSRGAGPIIKKEVSKKLNKLGWANSIKIEPTKLTINFMKRRVGLCLQLGNVARTYADLLKIQLLYYRKSIDVGIIIVPVKVYSKIIGSNCAQFERLKEEILLFDSIINMPLVLIGLST